MSTKLYSTVAQVMDVPVSQISEQSSPETIESWDSFHGLVLLDELETTFNVKFTLDEVLNTKTVSDIKTNLLNHGVLFDG
jgi:acyl carrier protein